MKKMQIAQLIWLHHHPRFSMITESIGPYDPDTDYVGPKKRKWLTKLVPRKLLGMCDINPCAWLHDGDYKIGGTEFDRARSDAEFLGNMFFWIQYYEWPCSNIPVIGWPIEMKFKRSAESQALYYYYVVRMLGSSSFNYIT